MTSISRAILRRICRRPFPSPVSRASLRRAVKDNPDLPVAFVADTLAAMAEARASIAAGHLAGLGGSEPGITADRRQRKCKFCTLPLRNIL